MPRFPREDTRQPAHGDVPAISLALQGGGAHGAFTWGVLDRLLEEVEAGQLRIAALSGTSAGAMNAAVCGYGLRSGPTAARIALGRFWAGMHNKAMRLGNPYLWVPYNAAGKGWNFDDLPLTAALNVAAQFWSPYLSPFYKNPLVEVVNRIIGDFAVLNDPGDDLPRVYVAATNIGKGSRKVFGPGELRTEVLLASACRRNPPRRSRSTAPTTGTAASPPIRRWSRWWPMPTTWSSSSSTRASATASRPGARATSPTE